MTVSPRGALSLRLLLLTLLGVLSGPVLADEDEAPLQLVATTAMVADALREVGGERVEVQGLMGPGVDPHLYRQTRSDVTAMSRADAVFWNGLNLEAQLRNFLSRLAARKPVFAVGEAVPAEQRLADEAYPDQPDPHVWMDPGRWRWVVEGIRDALAELAPDHAQEFAARTEAYLAELEALDRYAARVLDSVPTSARVLVTAHDAFGYFGDAYEYEVLGIQGFSTESEAGLARIESLVDVLVDRRIGAIFIESSVSDRNVQALVEGAAAEDWTVEIGGELFSDAMGPAATYEGTWLGMLDHNVTLIARALGGEAPAAGRLGRLGKERSE